jgi:hypothetical protein
MDKPNGLLSVKRIRLSGIRLARIICQKSTEIWSRKGFVVIP